MAFIIGIFQFNLKNEHKQLKLTKIKQDMRKSDSIFLYLQSITVLE